MVVILPRFIFSYYLICLLQTQDLHHKNFVNELPTLSRLSILRPDLYEHWCYVGCGQATETPEHLWTCSAYTTKLQIVVQITKDDLTHRLAEVNISKFTEFLPELLNILNDILATPTSRSDGYINIIRSLIPSSLVDIVHKITRNKGQCFSIITQTLIIFQQKLFEDVWKHRCNLMIAKERSLGITIKVKTIRGASSFLRHEEILTPTHNWENWLHLANKFGYTFTDF